MMETVMATALDVFRKQINTNKKIVIARLAMCSLFCLCGLFLTSRVS